MDDEGRSFVEMLAEGVDEDRRKGRQTYNGSERREPTSEAVMTITESGLKRFKLIWGAGAIVFAGLVAVGVLTNPIETKVAAAEAHAEINKRLDGHEQQLGVLRGQLQSMQRTGQLSLQLQLQGRISDIERQLRNLPENSGAAAALAETRLDLQQQLNELTRDLRK